MQTLLDWLSEVAPDRKVLDFGCGAGSFDYTQLRCAVVGIDQSQEALQRAVAILPVQGDGTALPFRDGSFDLVLCHHSLEHVPNAAVALREIRRVLRPDGRLFISVPDGYSFSDHLYRFLLAGGGHLQRFAFAPLVTLVRAETGLHLASFQNLHSSFVYLDRLNFVPAPRGRLPGPLPRRMRWLGHVPSFAFDLLKFFLNYGTRTIDSLARSHLSYYGWALAFHPANGRPVQESSYANVCMWCGEGSAYVSSVGGLAYRCAKCHGLNPMFGGGRTIE